MNNSIRITLNHHRIGRLAEHFLEICTLQMQNTLMSSDTVKIQSFSNTCACFTTWPLIIVKDSQGRQLIVRFLPFQIAFTVVHLAIKMVHLTPTMVHLALAVALLHF